MPKIYPGRDGYKVEKRECEFIREADPVGRGRKLFWEYREESREKSKVMPVPVLSPRVWGAGVEVQEEKDNPERERQKEKTNVAAFKKEGVSRPQSKMLHD